MINGPLFYRRTRREEIDQFSRQIFLATGKKSKNPLRVLLTKNNFVVENIKILNKDEFNLGFVTKLNLSLQTVFVWFRKIYIRTFLVGILKKSLPAEKYKLIEKNLR